MPGPTVNIVIVTHNTGPFIERCLAHVAASDRTWCDMDAVVVDNGSSDGTVQRLRALAYPWLTVIDHGHNAGFAAASNVGIRASSGDYVLLLNPDTEVPPSTIGAMVRFMEETPRAAVVTPRLDLESGEIDHACHRGFPTPWASFTYMTGLERLFPKQPWANGYHRWHLGLDTVHEIDAPSGAFMLIRRSVIDEIGDLDERFFMYTEDVDFCMRAKQAGYGVWYHPGERVLHVKGTSTGIKKHSDHVSGATMHTRLLCLNAFYDSTKRFYDKHYAAKYPRPLKWAVHGLVEGARPFAVWRLRRRSRQTRGAASRR